MAPSLVVPSFCSSRNINVLEPEESLWPRKELRDPGYTMPELKLRGAIHIPKGFTRGAKLPVILCPGTATPAGISYRFNIYRLLAKSDFADPVFLNIPGTTVGDIQVTAEYFAYAIHYISSISSGEKHDQRVAIIAQSQGCVNTQWVLKYWPSTRNVVCNFVAISAAFSGSVSRSRYKDIIWRVTSPAILQQLAHSNFIITLRGEDGGSAYVPTTSIYSTEDELVVPQSGSLASARLGDARSTGVLNAEIQVHCPKSTRAGKKVTHVGVIYNSFTWALIKDALIHVDAGDVKRLDLREVHRTRHAPSVSLLDIVLTRVGDLISIVYLLKYMPKRKTEPPTAHYAIKSENKD